MYMCDCVFSLFGDSACVLYVLDECVLLFLEHAQWFLIKLMSLYARLGRPAGWTYPYKGERGQGINPNCWSWKVNTMVKKI